MCSSKENKVKFKMAFVGDMSIVTAISGHKLVLKDTIMFQDEIRKNVP